MIKTKIFQWSVKSLHFFILSCLVVHSYGQHVSTDIRLNQIGFYPNSQKIAVVARDLDAKFYISTPDLSKTLYSGELSKAHSSSYSKTITRVADFSNFETAGTYVLYIPEIGYSYPFEIKPNVYRDLATGALKAFYYQRMSTPLPVEYAGAWSRPAGHPDDKVFIHPSAATEKRTASSVISSPKGWYDAGDYNKYIVNSGITVGTMLSLYEDYSAFCDNLNTHIPESGNGLPDLLNENLWNIRWMLTMQDPGDGGVYHKLTNPGFDGFIMPADAKAPRYVVQKSTAAALDFAAVMAQASRIFKKFSKKLPGLSDSCLLAAEKAWNWAIKNPSVLYNQNAMNAKFEPKVFTGEYGDGNVSDEFSWAAAELYITTKKDSYFQSVVLLPVNKMEVPSWGDVCLLGYYSLLRFEKELTPVAVSPVSQMKKNLAHLADSLLAGIESNSYMTSMNNSPKNFVWGSNAVAANQGILFLQVYKQTQNRKYLNAASSLLDYLLGRNATGYSYVTGFGDKTPMYPHHRPSASDEVLNPVPGLLSGGPNPGRQDGCTYASSVPDEAYVDVTASYASNEIAINWNSPLVYLVWAIEANQ